MSWRAEPSDSEMPEKVTICQKQGGTILQNPMELQGHCSVLCRMFGLISSSITHHIISTAIINQ